MDLIYQAEPREIVLALDLEYDLGAAGLLLDTYGNDGPLTDTEVESRRAENSRRVAEFEASFLDTLRTIGAERRVTIYVGDQRGATSTVINGDGDTLEREIWQEAHNRTPVSRAPGGQ